jgi:tRNA-specific adenosine deaminase 3
LVRKIIPDDGGLDLQHLRRFAKYEDLPEEVRALISNAQSPLTTNEDNDPSKDRILIVGPVNAISQQSLTESLSAFISVSIWSIPVPLFAPTSQEQASLWTLKYWPTIYKKVNPFGPHFSLISKAEIEIQKDVDKWMNLAAEVASEASTTGSGEHIGVVIVERLNGLSRPVAVAGDARWQDWRRTPSGNVTAHAALRAIAMVAEGLKLSEKIEKGNGHSIEPEALDIFRDQPLGQVERKYYQPSASSDGYLCHELEIYCTHEPCVMCSMAIVHSRFGKVVFKQRMPHTGGLCADGRLGHGLFWRKELNWTMLAWQWSHGESDSYDEISAQLHA